MVHELSSRYPVVESAPGSAKRLYSSLLTEASDPCIDSLVRCFLAEKLNEAAACPVDLPDDVAELSDWVQRKSQAVGRQYQTYLKQRKSGGKRRFFSTRSHALYFLKVVAPTKLVDGAWLYGLLRHWQAGRFEALIRTYLEELGEGVPDKNHVVIYRKLLSTHGIDGWQKLSDMYFMQGALQLALARQADAFLPELIGYNLGYEQLPLHLLISAHEQQLIHDWIAGEAAPMKRYRMPGRFALPPKRRPHALRPRGLFRPSLRVAGNCASDNELRRLEQELADLPDRESLASSLVTLMSPTNHHTPAGLMATRMFSHLHD